MEYRIEHDTMGEVCVPAEHFWGAQTERSLENFRIGTETIPREVIHAFAVLKSAAATANHALGKLPEAEAQAITDACRDICDGKYPEEFPLKVWQTGSGTQSNMNMNEVIAHIAMHDHPELKIHPNDHVNMSQSSNDVFPAAMHISAVLVTENSLIPALCSLIEAFKRLEAENEGIIKSGRTHLQDATPIRFSQEISGWRSSLEKDLEMIRSSLRPLRALALGGTAVGTGLNAPKGFDIKVAAVISELTGTDFYTAENKFHALSSKDELVFAHGALKALAADLMKIANDIRWLAGGPRCGLGEISIPENEPGSSIMPGKVNPTQCEAVTMVAVQVFGNDTAVSMAASQGNFQLNVFMPVIIYNYLQSVTLLADVMRSFETNCVCGIRANRERMQHYVDSSLMLVTALSPHIGYENAAAVVKKAHRENLTLRESCIALGYLDGEKFDELFHPEQMC